MVRRLPKEVYSPREIALAARVPEGVVLAALAARAVTPAAGTYVQHDEAVRIGRRLAQLTHNGALDGAWPPMFSSVAAPIERPLFAPFAVSGTLHAGFAVLLVFITGAMAGSSVPVSLGAAAVADPMRLVFMATPGPGGGGGGGGLLQRALPPKAMRTGTNRVSSPLPARREPSPIETVYKPPEPKPIPPLSAEQLPVVVAPIISVPADPRDRNGVLAATNAEADSHGPGRGGGGGTGAGTGLGSGDGPGIGPGSGGGTGGGPFRPGSGIQPPRLLHEVKADYTEDARRRGIAGSVVLEIVVRRDGSVGEVRILQGLDSGLDQRAIQAVRQWRFAPAERQGSPVDVIVEVAVEFTLR